MFRSMNSRRPRTRSGKPPVRHSEGAPFEKKMFTKTYEGITFDPMYTRKHTEDILPKGVMPGMGDYLRGVDAAGYIGKPWGIAQACDETLPAENNELLRHEHDKGATIYHIVLDTASRTGVDARQAETVGRHRDECDDGRGHARPPHGT